MNNFAIIIAGASGAGKTTVADRLILELGIFDVSRSATTRSMRADARKDEYIYLSESEFSRMIENGEILEHTVYDGNMYGTPRSELDRIVGAGKVPLLILDMNGVASLKGAILDYPVYSIYLYAPLKTLEKRLYERYSSDGVMSVDGLLAFQRRKTANIEDYLSISEDAGRVDFFLENTDIDACIDELKNLIKTLMCGSGLNYTEQNGKIRAAMRTEALSYK